MPLPKLHQIARRADQDALRRPALCNIHVMPTYAEAAASAIAARVPLDSPHVPAVGILVPWAVWKRGEADKGTPTLHADHMELSTGEVVPYGLTPPAAAFPNLESVRAKAPEPWRILDSALLEDVTAVFPALSRRIRPVSYSARPGVASDVVELTSETLPNAWALIMPRWA